MVRLSSADCYIFDKHLNSTRILQKNHTWSTASAQCETTLSVSLCLGYSYVFFTSRPLTIMVACQFYSMDELELDERFDFFITQMAHVTCHHRTFWHSDTLSGPMWCGVLM